ncbi:MAG TPA: cell wall hydrolase [Gammaproteobacteria bacterium]|nr:cell wall hydrolase [Gammaproteobacteria bacterium]
MRATLSGAVAGLLIALFWLDLGPFPVPGLSLDLAPRIPAAPEARTAAGNATAPPGEGPFAFSGREAGCLARTVFFEARDQSLKGQLSVALVALHRAREGRYPGDLCSVIHQVAAFSWYSDGKPDDPRDYPGPANRRAWQTARQLVATLRASRLNDPTDGADHYHAAYVSPEWSSHFAQTARIGDHLFYRGRR